jgi:tRNA pseudouridine13 synthase
LEEDERARLRGASLTLPSSRAEFKDESQRRLTEEVLAQTGLAIDQLRVKYPRDCFFSRGQRKVLTTTDISTGSPEPDDVYPGRRKLLLEFELPRGAYATIVVKRVTSAS